MPSYRPFPLSKSQEKWLETHDDTFKQIKDRHRATLAYKDTRINLLTQERNGIRRETEDEMAKQAEDQRRLDTRSFLWTLAWVALAASVLGMKAADAYYFGW